MISEQYLTEQKRLHENPGYGVASLSFAPVVAQLIRDNGYKSLHDYGAGKRRLRDALENLGVSVQYSAYEPAFPEFGPPQGADITCCIDVLEHVEPEHLDAVLDDLKRVTTVGFFTVHTGPARKVLSDGRNAHLIQEPLDWWLPKFRARWTVEYVSQFPHGFFVIVSAE